MKLVINLCCLIAIMLGASQCNNSKDLVKNPPFKTGDVMSEGWIGANKIESGTNLFIPITNGKEVVLDSVYFKGDVVKLERIQEGDYMVYIGRFKNTSVLDKNFVMHSDPKKELGNKPPKIKKKLPFELKENEAIISFYVDDEEKYYKIQNIKISPTVKN